MSDSSSQGSADQREVEPTASQDPEPKPAPAPAPESAPQERVTIFVNNFRYEVTEVEFRNKFAEFGNVTKASIPRQPDGQSKGFGFIEYSSRASAQAAIDAMNNKEWDGRPLQIEFSGRDRLRRDSSPPRRRYERRDRDDYSHRDRSHRHRSRYDDGDRYSRRRSHRDEDSPPPRRRSHRRDSYSE